MLKIIHIDELVCKCGHFNSETNVNNGYGCNHPEQEEKEKDWDGNIQGKCYSFSCPLASEADLEDMKKYDKDLYKEYKNEEYDPTESGAQYMLYDESDEES